MKVLNLKKLYGDATGPLGFPMLSEAASELERLIKDAPAECRELGYRRAFKVAARMDFEDGERADISLVTTDTLDHDREVVDPAGMDWSVFRRNAQVTFAHKYDALPVGRSMWVKRKREGDVNGWIAKTAYHSRPEGWTGEWLPDAVWHMVRSGDLPGKSIGFYPLDIHSPTPDEIKRRPELAECRAVISKSLVLEYAVAPIPANPDALVQSVAKARAAGIVTPDLVMQELGLILPKAPDVLDCLEDREPPKKNAASSEDMRCWIRAELKRQMAALDTGALVRDALELARGRV